ncbi:UvrD-helicase domain-containing protein, partial [Faecalibaculum rodentium]|uniref:UvrD-helicase domain-containing protein n=7 Tax=Faecalibaculum rodentium TaxID=1702221 RepID=UPI00258F1F59
KELNEIWDEKAQLGFDAEFLNEASSTIELMSFRKLFDLLVRKPAYDELQLSEKVSGQYQFELYLMLFCCTLYFSLVRQEENLVCIDEAQDLSECELLTLKRVLGHRCHFNLYGDTNQLVYPYKGIRDWKQCRLTASMPVYELNQNYRNTRQITEFCNEEIDMKVQSIGIEGKVVKVIPESQLRLALMDCMPSENRSTAVIHSGTNTEVSSWINRILGHKHVAVGELHPKKVSVLTVEEAKGLEFYSVVVLPQGMSENEQYVAFTRALHELTVIEA